MSQGRVPLTQPKVRKILDTTFQRGSVRSLARSFGSILGSSPVGGLTINRLDAIVAFSGELGFDVGFDFVGDFLELRNIVFQLIHWTPPAGPGTVFASPM